MSASNRAASTPWSHRILLLVALATVLRVWFGPIPVEPTAQAQLPNQGAKLAEQLAETQRTNQLLVEIRDLLKHGTLSVREAPPAKSGR